MELFVGLEVRGTTMFPYTVPLIAGGEGKMGILVRGENGDSRHEEFSKYIGGFGWKITPYFADGSPLLEGEITSKTRKELEGLSLTGVHQEMVDIVLERQFGIPW